jgi:hypothetical protein
MLFLVLYDDVNFVVPFDNAVSAETVFSVSGASSGFDVELPAVPRANDVEVVGVFHATIGLIGTEVLLDPVDHQSLADRSALMGAFVQISMDCTVGAKHADCGLSVSENFPLAFFEVGGAGNEQLRH